MKSQQHLEININDLFSYPSAAQLARYAYIANNVAASPGKQAESLASLSPQAPLSLAQQSLWKIYQALGCGEAFNIPFALRFLDPIDEGLFFQAFQDILLRHPALRTLFVDISGEVFSRSFRRRCSLSTNGSGIRSLRICRWNRRYSAQPATTLSSMMSYRYASPSCGMRKMANRWFRYCSTILCWTSGR